MTPPQVVTLKMAPRSGDPAMLKVGAIIELVHEGRDVLVKVLSYDHANGVLKVEPLERDAVN